MFEGYHKHSARVGDATAEGLAAMVPYYRAHMAGLLPEDRAAAILDVGCGYGRVLFALREWGYRNCAGIDASSDQVEAARRNGLANAEASEAGPYLREHRRTFDAIVLFDVLEHVQKAEIPSFLAELLGALQPGGRLILQTPNGLSPMSPYRYDDFTHELCFTPHSIEQVLEAAGFESIAAWPVEPHVHGLASFLRALLWKAVVVPLIRAYFLVTLGGSLGGVYTPNLIAVAYRPKSSPVPQPETAALAGAQR